MSGRAYEAVVYQLALPEVLAVVVITVVVAAFYYFLAKLPFQSVLAFSMPFGFLGGTTGLIAGATSEPIVGAFLTGLLGIISGVLSLSFVKQTSPDDASTLTFDITNLIGPSIIVLSLTALAGLAIGRVYQTQWVNYERTYTQIKDLNEKVNMPLAKLWKQHEYCRSKVKDPGACDSILLQTD